jgi:hypothetical protein
VVLAPQADEPGYKYYYSYAVDSVGAPAYGSLVADISGAVPYSEAADVPAEAGSTVWVQVYKTLGGKVVAFGEASGSPWATKLKFASSRVSASAKAKTVRLSLVTDAKDLRFESANPLICTVDEEGVVTVRRSGMTTVKVTATDGSGLTDTAVIVATP